MNVHHKITNSAELPAEQDPRWQAVVRRDRTFDGQFFYSVKTTCVYCRPSCAARLANPKNVRFHLTQADARQAGFRPCKRCKPDLIAAAADSESASDGIRYAIGTCSLGAVLVAQSANGICAVLLGDDAKRIEKDFHKRFSKAIRDDRRLAKPLADLVEFVEQPSRGFDLRLDLQGTTFQQRVWKALAKIPTGKTASYAEIARRVGTPTAVRAVAQACAANAIAVAIPCHRVVRSDGTLSGYRWGVERKRALLARETLAA
ncbi:MAG: methylated-DNA--[protein]-cysteine S-methyltransferase [Proteobacteria bacterium]|nr:methylated-DNA--[protein]-cysteine S-methyltransferase [Pseudomonadota bacterium]